MSKEAVDSSYLAFESHMKDIQTLLGTRSFHNFQPISDLRIIEAKRTSSDEKPALTFNLCNKQQTLFVKEQDLLTWMFCFCACIYGNMVF